MHTTIFDTPVVNTLTRGASHALLRLCGWRAEGLTPEQLAAQPKFVLIAAPHTSNWDFPFTLMLCFVLRMRVYWMAKASLFAWPIGWLSRWLGGIAIDRSASNNTVQATIDAFARHERLIVIVAPEGTRGKVTHWKTGFYHMAHGAGVPIAMAYLDFKRKRGGIGQMFVTTGDIDADMAQIQQFYRGITGKNSDQFDAASIR
ncbi:MAG: lysophospholipid acyltransferase family protein [Pseudomonadota bacterium]